MRLSPLAAIAASGTEKSIYDISFADEKNGWAVGRRGFVIHTTDGGDTWERQRIPREPAQHLFAVHAVTPRVAWAVGSGKLPLGRGTLPKAPPGSFPAFLALVDAWIDSGAPCP